MISLFSLSIWDLVWLQRSVFVLMINSTAINDKTVGSGHTYRDRLARDLYYEYEQSSTHATRHQVWMKRNWKIWKGACRLETWASHGLKSTHSHVVQLQFFFCSFFSWTPVNRFSYYRIGTRYSRPRPRPRYTEYTTMCWRRDWKMDIYGWFVPIVCVGFISFITFYWTNIGFIFRSIETAFERFWTVCV